MVMDRTKKKQNKQKKVCATSRKKANHKSKKVTNSSLIIIFCHVIALFFMTRTILYTNIHYNNKNNFTSALSSDSDAEDVRCNLEYTRIRIIPSNLSTAPTFNQGRKSLINGCPPKDYIQRLFCDVRCVECFFPPLSNQPCCVGPGIVFHHSQNNRSVIIT